MKIKRIKSIEINSFKFKIKWNNKHGGGSFSYDDRIIKIGTGDESDEIIFMIICHELMEIVALEFNVRLSRPDCSSDYIFVYDHRQHETMMNLFASLIGRFIE